MKSNRLGRPTGAAFLLAQLGSLAARKFGARIESLDIAPPHAGILNLIDLIPACSQKALANRLGIQPSRMVILLDELTEKGLVARTRSTRDRRSHELALTRKGQNVLQKMRKLAGEHEADLLSILTPEERSQLASLCQKVADHQGLTRLVHPGYRDL